MNKKTTLTDQRSLWIIVVFWVLLLPLLHPWINSDGIAYYAQLRSIVIDGDLQYSNEFDYYYKIFTGDSSAPKITSYKPAHDKSGLFSPDEPRTITNHTPNRTSCGPALLWLPFFLIGHLLAYLYYLFTDTNLMNGYSLFYVGSISFGTAIYGLMTLILSYKFVRNWYSCTISLLSIIGLLFTTPFIYYQSLVPSMAHVLSCFSISLFLWVWWKLKDKGSLEYLLIGLLAGLVGLVRWQNLPIILIPYIWFWLKNKSNQYLSNSTALSLGLFLGFLPQLIVWKIVYGFWFLIPMGNETMNWASPRIWDVLFSSRHGFLTWNPVYFLVLIGLGLQTKEHRTRSILFDVFILFQIYINAVPDNWWAGSSFGYRRLLDLYPIYCLGLAGLLSCVRIRIGLFVLLMLSVWNINLMLQFALGMVSHSESISWLGVIRNTVFEIPKNLGKVIKYVLYRQ